jgi:hypothetical protein
MNPDAVNGRLARRHAHKPNGSAGEALCPYCGQPISRKEFKEIGARIEAEERARIAEIERTLKQRFARERQQAAVATQNAVEKAQKDAAAQVEKIRKEGAAREASIRQAATKVATAALAPKIAEAVRVEKQRHFAETLKLAEQLEDAKRRLEKRTAHELGEEGETDLFEMLRAQFPGDQITRVPKGRNGADVVHRIVHGGNAVGTIVLDFKNTKTYQTKWSSKLRQDQIAAQADHALLVTTSFPSGHRHVLFRDGILIVSPARVVELVKWVRTHTIRMHALRITNEAKSAKSERLYSFMVSDRVAERWTRMTQTITRMRDGLRAERNAHERSWSDRTDQIEIIQKIREAFVEDLDAIFEATDAVAAP